MRISDWSSDVCSSDLPGSAPAPGPLRAPDAEPAGAQSAAPGPRRPALHERLRADLGRRAGKGEWGIGNGRGAKDWSRGSCSCLQSIPRDRPPVPAPSHSPFPIPPSRLSIMNRKGDKAHIDRTDNGTSKVVATVGESSPGPPIWEIGIGSHHSSGHNRGVGGAAYTHVT